MGLGTLPHPVLLYLLFPVAKPACYKQCVCVICSQYVSGTDQYVPPRPVCLRNLSLKHRCGAHLTAMLPGVRFQATYPVSLSLSTVPDLQANLIRKQSIGNHFPKHWKTQYHSKVSLGNMVQVNRHKSGCAAECAHSLQPGTPCIHRTCCEGGALLYMCSWVRVVAFLGCA